jgi:hypothetical protein
MAKKGEDLKVLNHPHLLRPRVLSRQEVTKSNVEAIRFLASTLFRVDSENLHKF